MLSIHTFSSNFRIVPLSAGIWRDYVCGSTIHNMFYNCNEDVKTNMNCYYIGYELIYRFHDDGLVQ